MWPCPPCPACLGAAAGAGAGGGGDGLGVACNEGRVQVEHLGQYTAERSAWRIKTAVRGGRAQAVGCGKEGGGASKRRGVGSRSHAYASRCRM